MNNRLQPAAANSSDGETILDPEHAGARAKVCRPRREAAGSGPHLTSETQVLLRSRLRAAALILLVGFFNDRKRLLHDMVVGTVVINSPARAQIIRDVRP